MTLDELIAALEAEEPSRVLPLGFANPHSYRGNYTDLAFEPATSVAIDPMLADARSALGATYQGWKGGDYTMHGYTDCYIAEEGRLGEEIGPILLTLLFAGDQLDAVTREKLSRFGSETARWAREGARSDV